MGTPSSAARSMSSSHSPPESWMDTMPPGAARRGWEKASSVAASSSTSRTRRAPWRSNSAA